MSTTWLAFSGVLALWFVVNTAAGLCLFIKAHRRIQHEAKISRHLVSRR